MKAKYSTLLTVHQLKAMIRKVSPDIMLEVNVRLLFEIIVMVVVVLKYITLIRPILLKRILLIQINSIS